MWQSQDNEDRPYVNAKSVWLDELDQKAQQYLKVDRVLGMVKNIFCECFLSSVCGRVRYRQIKISAKKDGPSDPKPHSIHQCTSTTRSTFPTQFHPVSFTMTRTQINLKNLMDECKTCTVYMYTHTCTIFNCQCDSCI